MSDDDDLIESFARAYPTTRTDLERMRERLAADAHAAGVLDIAYRTLDTPVGSLLLAATTAGLVKVAYPSQSHDRILQLLADTISPRVLHAPARLDAATQQLQEYFAGARQDFDLIVDTRLSTGFRATVLRQLSRIEYGHTASYATVARLAGNPRAVRAVGTSCATNPLPIIVPCHRVVRSDGTSGDYIGGTEAKQILLSLESRSAA